MPIIQPEPLADLCQHIFEAAGAPPDISAYVTKCLVETNLMGHDSHGVLRVIQYIERINAGKLIPDARPQIKKRFGATAVVDGQNGFGQIAAQDTAEVTRDLGLEHGISCVTLGRTNHIGRLGEYGQIIASDNTQIGIVFTSGTMFQGWVAPFGGRERVFGTNPMAWAVPRGNDQPPILLDFATAAIAQGKAMVARSEGKRLAEGLILDKDGQPSTDPNDLMAGGLLKAFGEHKGSGLAMMMEILPNLLSGEAPTSSSQFKQSNPTMMMAISIEAFTTTDRFMTLVNQLVEKIKSVTTIDGVDEVLLPGEPERISIAKRQVEGIPLPDPVWNDLMALAETYGIEGNWLN